ncbi:Protein kinase-like domain [Colletotrichum asianum]
MQHVASLAIDNLVPNTFQTGVASNAQGKRLQFSVIEFIEGDTLEEAWEQMSSESQQSVVTALVGALGKLHSIRISDPRVQTLLRQVLDDSKQDSFQEAVMGGPSTGFLKTGPALLGAITKRLELKGPFYTIMPTMPAGDVVVQSQYEDLGSLKLEKSNMEQWGHESVLCHNDLTPRNIIVKPCNSPDGRSDYQLSAIIDWELAGFYPASYELSLQDTYLSGGNRLISFYSLLKRQMKDLVPASSSQVSLLQVMEILFESRQRRLAEGSNIPAIIRQRFIQKLQLRRDEDPYIGWVPKNQGEAQPVLSRAGAQRLEDDVIVEVIEKR